MRLRRSLLIRIVLYEALVGTQPVPERAAAELGNAAT